MKKTGKFLARFWGDEKGSIGTEYGVLMVIIALGMAVAASLLGVAISNALNRGASCLNAVATCAPYARRPYGAFGRARRMGRRPGQSALCRFLSFTLRFQWSGDCPESTAWACRAPPATLFGNPG